MHYPNLSFSCKLPRPYPPPICTYNNLLTGSSRNLSIKPPFHKDNLISRLTDSTITVTLWDWVSVSSAKTDSSRNPAQSSISLARVAIGLVGISLSADTNASSIDMARFSGSVRVGNDDSVFTSWDGVCVGSSVGGSPCLCVSDAVSCLEEIFDEGESSASRDGDGICN